MVDVCIHPEEALEHGPHHVHKVWREWHPILLWENSRIIHLQTVELCIYMQAGNISGFRLPYNYPIGTLADVMPKVLLFLPIASEHMATCDCPDSDTCVMVA